jgi:hypothetical protein
VARALFANLYPEALPVACVQYGHRKSGWATSAQLSLGQPHLAEVTRLWTARPQIVPSVADLVTDGIFRCILGHNKARRSYGRQHSDSDLNRQDDGSWRAMP